MSDDLATWITDPTAFVGWLAIPSASGTTRFREVMQPFQRDVFQAMAPSLLAVAAGSKPPIGRFWVERTKGASKDSDLACALTWLLLFTRRPLEIQIAAADQGQADELRKAMRDIARLNRFDEKRQGGELLTVLSDRIVSSRTGSTAYVLTCDKMGAHGSRPDILICNELSHVSSREFVETLLDNATKMPRSLVVIATNAGARDTWQYEWRQLAESSPDRWSMHVWDKPAPWLDPADVSEAERRNPPTRFRRLYHGIWSSGEGDALEAEWIDRAITLPGPADGPERGWVYAAGLDLGLRHDHTALLIVAKHVGYQQRVEDSQPVSRITRIIDELGPVLVRRPDFGNQVEDDFEDPPVPHRPAEYREIPGSGRVKLVAVRVWRPTRGGEVDLSDVERTLAEWSERFRLRLILGDEWQLASLRQRMHKAGLPIEGESPTASIQQAQAQAVLSAFRDRTVDLYDDADLIRDLRDLRLTETSRGIRLESPRNANGHGDTASAFALALLAAGRVARRRAPRVDRRLVYN